VAQNCHLLLRANKLASPRGEVSHSVVVRR
jgi:hypothetical protein